MHVKTTRTASRAACALIVLAVAGALASGLALAGCAESDSGKASLVNSVTTQEGIAYTLYVGLADADTGQQELTMDEAAAIATPMVSEAGGGYTVYRTQGGFTGDDGALVENDTLVYDGLHADEAAVKQLIDDLKAALNIESIYVTSEIVGYAIYGGQL